MVNALNSPATLSFISDPYAQCSDEHQSQLDQLANELDIPVPACSTLVIDTATPEMGGYDSAQFTFTQWSARGSKREVKVRAINNWERKGLTDPALKDAAGLIATIEIVCSEEERALSLPVRKADRSGNENLSLRRLCSEDLSAGTEPLGGEQDQGIPFATVDEAKLNALASRLYPELAEYISNQYLYYWYQRLGRTKPASKIVLGASPTAVPEPK